MRTKAVDILGGSYVTLGRLPFFIDATEGSDVTAQKSSSCGRKKKALTRRDKHIDALLAVQAFTIKLHFLPSDIAGLSVQVCARLLHDPRKKGREEKKREEKVPSAGRQGRNVKNENNVKRPPDGEFAYGMSDLACRNVRAAVAQFTDHPDM